MGRFLNVTTKGFQESIQSEIYVDKTKMIALLNQVIDTEQKYVCVSRPRRFGKSMTIKMLSAYYHSETDSDPLFRNLKIAADPFYDKYRNRYEVVLINMQDFYHKAIGIRQMIQNMNIRICHELTKKFSDVAYTDPADAAETMYDIFLSTDRTFIILIDEWDCIFRESDISEKDWQLYLDFLRGWFKDKPYISLAYLMGILLKGFLPYTAPNPWWNV